MNFIELREKAFSRVVLLISTVSYLLVTWALWPSGSPSPIRLFAGLIGCALALSCVSSHWIGRRKLGVASLMLMVNLTACISIGFLLLRSADFLYLFIFPISLAGILFDKTAGIIITIYVLILNLLAAVVGWTTDPLPISLVGLVIMTGANLIVLSNLYTALTWALLGYDTARRNQDIARERKGEIEETLNSLNVSANTLHRTNEALKLARTQADEARALKQNFAQMISHELRTPLNLIVGFTETMMKSPETYGGALGPRYLRDLSVVYRNASHLQSLVNDVLDLARIDIAQMSLQLEETSISDVVDDVISAAQGLSDIHHCTFESEIESNLPTLWVDPIRIRQIIYNLINNAVRYASNGRVKFRVYRCDDKPDTIEFSVSDTGIGIPTDQLQQIFEPFHQVTSPGHIRKGGVGLGLTISRNLARMHGGDIRVESKLGIGSTFCFHLPVQPMVAKGTSVSAMPDHSVRLIAHHDHVVLLVTKSLSAVNMLSRHLKGCRTIVANDFSKAETIIRQIIPQIVIIDALDPDFDADKIAEQMISWGLPDAYLIICSLPGEELLRRQFGVYSYLIKPITQPTLWDTLQPLGDSVRSILVVDDDQNFTRLIERLLDNRLKRYRVFQAHSGLEALEVITRQSPDLILLDLDLPDIDGIQVIEKLREQPQFSDIKVIVITGNDLNLTMNKCGKLTVLKPAITTSTDVLNWISALLDTHLRS
ncbi:MAG: response regulator [Anaerolineaceae bacterium]|nr:response regulator [Anaerolineaceae bacterium]